MSSAPHEPNTGDTQRLPPVDPPEPIGATQTAPPAETPPSSGSGSSVDHGLFLPGTILARRFRIIELLGKGGMGQVYRAEDLQLGQNVALKFLTDQRLRDSAARLAMLNEVRVARKIAHPNVCHVYDIGVIDAYTFISMEYIDGEHLDSLVRRIGRLPQDKAVEIARQLCLGLHAIHAQDVLHRDLKPTNVMIDGRGKVRITDFGLSGLAEELVNKSERAGTPAYMPPEQIVGHGVTVRSDIYSLGLVLYELFTGKPAFPSASLKELPQRRLDSAPLPPSDVVEELHPDISRVILACLEREPRNRPASALAVLAGLPGGDPLAAALAAGETPSPETVAAHGGASGVNPRLAAAGLALIAIGVVTVAWLSPRVYLYGLVPLDKPPEVLADRARELIAALGYADPPGDSAYGFAEDADAVQFTLESDRSPDRWKRLKETNQAPALYFWYRQSPLSLAAENVGGRVSETDPPHNVPGMALVKLDTHGRLVGFRSAPSQRRAPGTSAVAPDWPALFARADLDFTDFATAEPNAPPPLYCDQLATWVRNARAADPTISVEAGAYRGQPVWFRVLYTWPVPSGEFTSGLHWKATILRAAWLALAISALPGGLLLAWRNVRLGRGDRRGAFRLMLLVVGGHLLAWALLTDHVRQLDAEWSLFVRGVGQALVFGAFVWVLYIALEPYVRRWRPTSLVAWSRLLAGQFRDPLIGRDILIGGLLAVVSQLVVMVDSLLPGWLGMPPHPPLPAALDGLSGLRPLVGSVLYSEVNACFEPMFALVIILVFRVVLRSTWAGVLAVVAIFTLLYTPTKHGMGEPAFLLDLLLFAPLVSAWIAALLRFGLLTAIAGWSLLLLISRYPLTLDFSGWYAQGPVLILILVAVGATYGFWIALAGRPLLGRVLRDA